MAGMPELAPALSNDCTAWLGFYTEFDVDYSKFINLTNTSYTATGGDMKVCFKGPTALNATDVYVSDLLTNVTAWPAGTPGPLTPPVTGVTNVSLMNSSHGF